LETIVIIQYDRAPIDVSVYHWLFTQMWVSTMTETQCES